MNARKEDDVIPTRSFGGPTSDYSVVISLRNLTKREIQNRLRAAFGTNFSAKAVIAGAGSLAACYKACGSAAHFGCVHWTEDDLQSKFKELGVPMTAEILDLVKSSYALRHIDDSMVKAGWEVIEQAIVDAQSVKPRG